MKTIKAYKLFRVRDGILYPLFVNATKPVETGKWLPAEIGPQDKAGKVKSRLGGLAFRPGWHSGNLPIATHIGGKSRKGLNAPDYRPANQVWAEVEIIDCIDWQSKANANAKINKAGKPIARTAQLSVIPNFGYYRYKTNPNMTGVWFISGELKVNRILTDNEVQTINSAHGVQDLPRKAV